ncbi:hypothetical protein [Dyella japonica]|uniref:hypothetical protein n=1 Tax=Dyella japonica TaxID=231455 RepID=UPI0003783704|nr:hypothetical protein [Dyella japonica]
MASATPKQLHWFEKTVEYAFVMNHARHLTWATPLDGNHERAADAIFTIEDSKWLLIEFKRAAGDFSSEERKFASHALAKEALSGDGECLHFFVYGTLPSGGRQLELTATPYWKQSPMLSVSELLDTKGTRDREFFWEYLHRLVEQKESAQGSQGGPDYSLIAAVTNEGHIRAISSLSEIFAPTPVNEPTFALRF